MQPKTLKFRAVGTALVQDHEALDLGVRKFIGKAWLPHEDAPGGHAFVPTGDVVVPYRQAYVLACQDGDLEPVDQETAEACGVKLPSAKKTAPDDEPKGDEGETTNDEPTPSDAATLPKKDQS